jgi:hypothetical protein
MTNFSVYEDSGKTVYSELETNPDINIGDTIEYLTNNQMGYEAYRVIYDEEAKNKKGLKLIDSYDHQMGVYDYEDDDMKEGGKKHKRKTNKRKSNKRKTTKRRKSRKTRTNK